MARVCFTVRDDTRVSVGLPVFSQFNTDMVLILDQHHCQVLDSGSLRPRTHIIPWERPSLVWSLYFLHPENTGSQIHCQKTQHISLESPHPNTLHLLYHFLGLATFGFWCSVTCLAHFALSCTLQSSLINNSELTVWQIPTLTENRPEQRPFFIQEVWGLGHPFSTIPPLSPPTSSVLMKVCILLLCSSGLMGRHGPASFSK